MRKKLSVAETAFWPILTFRIEMNFPFPLPIEFEQPAPKVQKQINKLPKEVKKQLADLFEELAEGQLKPGRRPEVIRGTTPGLYSVRLNRKYRLVYEFAEGNDEEKEDRNSKVARIIAIGPHDDAYGSI